MVVIQLSSIFSTERQTIRRLATEKRGHSYHSLFYSLQSQLCYTPIDKYSKLLHLKVNTFFFGGGVLGFWTQNFVLAKQAFYLLLKAHLRLVQWLKLKEHLPIKREVLNSSPSAIKKKKKFTPPVHYTLVILEMEVIKLFAWLASNSDPPDLSLPSSKDYKHESPTPSLK
jgi:hypothetical protein